MVTPVPRGLRFVFLLHAIGLVPLSIALVFSPTLWAQLVGWGAIDVTFVRLLGAALLPVAVGAYLASRVRTFAEVRVYLIFELVLGIMFVLVAGYEVLLGGAPAFTWAFVVGPGAFTIARLYYVALFISEEGAAFLWAPSR